MFRSKKRSPYVDEAIIDYLCDQNSNFSSNAITLSRKYSSGIVIINGNWFFQATNNRNFLSPLKSNHGKKRIYVIGHCIPSRDYLAGWDDKKISFKALASHLANYIDDSENVTINLIACYAAASVSGQIEDSFAAQLHRELINKKGRDIPVVARNFATCIMENDKDEIQKWTSKSEFTAKDIVAMADKRNATPINSAERKSLNKQLNAMFSWQQSRSKVVFMLDENKNQICVDAYVFQWRAKLFAVLRETQLHTNSSSKEKFLRNWETSFINLSDDEIDNIIKNELDNPNSVLKNHTNPISYFYKDANTHIKFKDLIEKRKRALQAPHETIVISKKS